MTFFLAAVWGLMVMGGLVGWGGVLGRILRPHHSLSMGLSGALGFSFSVLAGGLFGLFHLILPAVVIGFIVVGIVLLLVVHRGEPGRHRPGMREIVGPGRGRPGFHLLTLTLPAILATRYLASVHSTLFQYLDDTPAYVVFPVKMLQTGEFAPDPFSDRRLAGLGGQPWSQSLILALFDPTSINLFDHGVALLLLIGVAGNWLTKIGAGRWLTFTVLLVLVLFFPDFLNCCNFITLSLLLLAVLVFLLDDIHGPREAILLALIVSGLCSLKTTTIPFLGAMLGLYFLIKAVEKRSIRPVIFGSAVAVLSFAFLLPWMLAMHRSSGTFLCPFLGKGNSMLPSLVGSMPGKLRVISLSLTTAAAGVVVFLCMRNLPEHRNWSRDGAVFLLATAPVTYWVAVNTGGVSWMRYSQPILYALMPLPLAAVWIWSDAGGPRRRWMGTTASIVLAAGLVFTSLGWAPPFGPITSLGQNFSTIRDGLAWTSYPKVTAREIEQARAMQNAVPAGEPILARLDYPHLMNFRRNPVYIDDHPGLALPRPGLPERPDPQQLRAFLLAHGVHYIAYSYGDEANYRAADNADVAFLHLWDRLIARYTLGTQDAFMKLSKTQRIIYDDRFNFVIDLDAPAREEK